MVRAALEVVPAVADDYEIIIVDDGSEDRTGEIADRLAEEHSCIRAVHNRPNLGYGGALQRGFRAASKDYVFYTDGDGQFDICELHKLLPLLARYDIVSAYRAARCDSLMRRFNGWAWTVLVDVVFGFRLRDIDCAFKIFPRRLFDEIEMCSRGALIDAEILARACNRGYRIGQVGVRHLPRTAGTQSGANFRVILRAFKELFQLYWRIKRT